MMSGHWGFTFADISVSRHSPMRVTTMIWSMSRGVASPRPRPPPAAAARRACVHGQAGCCQQTLRIYDTRAYESDDRVDSGRARGQRSETTRHARALVLMRLMRVHAIFATS